VLKPSKKRKKEKKSSKSRRLRPRSLLRLWEERR